MAKPVPQHPTDHTTAGTTNSLTAQTGGDSVIRRVTYSLAGQAIAVQVTGDPDPTNNGLFYLHNDHLGSTSAMSSSSGQLVGGVTRYTPFGDYRSGGPNAITDKGFTGQKENMELGLYYYNARYYVPGIGRFASADTIVPNPVNPQSFNRYSYTFNNPLKFTDPSGHCAEFGDDTCWSAYDRLYAYMNAHPKEFLYDGSNWHNQEAWNEVGTWSQAAIEGFYDAIAHPSGNNHSQENGSHSIDIANLAGTLEGIDDILGLFKAYTGKSLGKIPGAWTLDGVEQLAQDWEQPYSVWEKGIRAGIAGGEGKAVDTLTVTGLVPAFEVGFYGTLPWGASAPPYSLILPPAAGLISTGIWIYGSQTGGDMIFDAANEAVIFPATHAIVEWWREQFE